MVAQQEFEALYRAEYAGVEHTVAARLRPGDDQESAIADSFTKVWSLMQKGIARNPRALLYRVANTIAIDAARRREYASDMIERLGVSDSRIREQQSLYAHKVRDTHGWRDDPSGDDNR